MAVRIPGFFPERYFLKSTARENPGEVVGRPLTGEIDGKMRNTILFFKKRGSPRYYKKMRIISSLSG
jgi:hypothetical protein